MDKDRPYFRNSIDELEILFEENVKNRSVLSALYKKLLHRSRPRAKELAKKVKAILDAPYQLDLPIDIQTTGEYDRTASWYGTIGWYENRVEEFKNDKNELQKILNTLLEWNFDDRTYNLIVKIQDILCQKHGLLIQYGQHTEQKLKNYKNKIKNSESNTNTTEKSNNYIKNDKEQKIPYWLAIPIIIIFIIAVIFGKDHIPGINIIAAVVIGIFSLLAGMFLPALIITWRWKYVEDWVVYVSMFLGVFILGPLIGDALFFLLGQLQIAVK